MKSETAGAKLYMSIIGNLNRDRIRLSELVKLLLANLGWCKCVAAFSYCVGLQWVKTRKAHFEQFSAASPRTADMTGRAARIAGPRAACRVSVCACTNHRNGLFGKLKLTKCARAGNRAGFFHVRDPPAGCAPEAGISVWLLANSQAAGLCNIPGRPAKRARLVAGHNRGSLFPPCIFRTHGGKAKGACVIGGAPTLFLHAKLPATAFHCCLQ